MVESAVVTLESDRRTPKHTSRMACCEAQMMQESMSAPRRGVQREANPCGANGTHARVASGGVKGWVEDGFQCVLIGRFLRT